MKRNEYKYFKIYCIIIEIINLIIAVIIRMISSAYWLSPNTIFANNEDAYLINNILFVLKFLCILLFVYPIYFIILFLILKRIRKKNINYWKTLNTIELVNDFTGIKKWYLNVAIISCCISLLLGWSVLFTVLMLLVIIPIHAFIYCFYIRYITTSVDKYEDLL